MRKTTQPGPKIRVPGQNELRPNSANADKSRGALAYVGYGVRMIGEFGSPAPGTSPTEVDKPEVAKKRRARKPTDDNTIPGEPR